MSLETYLQAAPKAELHIHLEGSILPENLLTLARRNGVSLPADTVDGLRQWFIYRDFSHFIEIYLTITRCLRHAKDYEYVVYEFGREMARQNIRYAEVTFTPGTHYDLGVPFEVYFDGLTKGRERALADFGVEIRWVFDIVRNIEPREKRLRLADYTTSVAIDGKNDGVVALGLGGLEAEYPSDLFAPYFERALKAGLHSAPHSGETAGPKSIWDSIRLLHAERLGHGVRSIEDPELMVYLAEHHLPLEVNPTSNVRLNVFPSMADHPLRRLVDAGVTVIVNSDDPPLFNTTLNDELCLLVDPFGFDVPALDTILLNGVRCSFLPAERKQALEAQFCAELDALKTQHLTA